MNIVEKIEEFFLHPKKQVIIALWSFFIAFWILLACISTFTNRPVTIKFNFALQLVEVEIGAERTQIPANIEIVDGRMFVNGIPIRTWLEQQGYQVIWDNEEQTAIAVPKK